MIDLLRDIFNYITPKEWAILSIRERALGIGNCVLYYFKAPKPNGKQFMVYSNK